MWLNTLLALFMNKKKYKGMTTDKLNADIEEYRLKRVSHCTHKQKHTDLKVIN